MSLEDYEITSEESTSEGTQESIPWTGWCSRGWHFPWGTATLLGVCAGLFCWVSLLADGDSDASAYLLLLSGAKINPQVLAGEWWRLISSSFLHGHFSHLVLNVLGIGVLGWSVEAIVGAGGLWGVAILSGAAGNILAVMLSPYPSVGASGMMYGLLGAALVLVWRRWGKLPAGQRLYLVAIPGALGLGALVFGLVSDDVNQYLHVGGLVAGALAGLAISLWARSGAIRGVARYAMLAALALAGVALMQTVLRLASPHVPVTQQVMRQDLSGLPPFLAPKGWASGAFVEGACDVGVVATNGTSACYVDAFHAVLVVGRRDRLERTPMGVLAASATTSDPITYAADLVYWQVDYRRDLAFALLAYGEWAADYGALFAAVGADPEAAGTLASADEQASETP